MSDRICHLRARIERAIRRHASDPAAAALAVCVVLEDEIGLSGNGWFDDDGGVSDALTAYYDQPRGSEE